MNLQSKLLGITGELSAELIAAYLKDLAKAGFSKEDWEKAIALAHTKPELRDPKDKEDLTNLIIQLMDDEEQLRNELLRKSHGFSDRLLCLMPLRYLERAYQPAKCDAAVTRLERLEKDGNEVAANREYHREMRKVVFFTFLTLPIFLMGEIWAQVGRMVSR
jgi:hypothetical protein